MNNSKKINLHLYHFISPERIEIILYRGKDLYTFDCCKLKNGYSGVCREIGLCTFWVENIDQLVNKAIETLSLRFEMEGEK